MVQGQQLGSQGAVNVTRVALGLIHGEREAGLQSVSFEVVVVTIAMIMTVPATVRHRAHPCATVRPLPRARGSAAGCAVCAASLGFAEQREGFNILLPHKRNHENGQEAKSPGLKNHISTGEQRRAPVSAETRDLTEQGGVLRPRLPSEHS